MDSTYRPALSLLVITALTGLLIGVVQHLTAEPIRQSREREKADALRRVLPAATRFCPRSGDLPPGFIAIEEGFADETPVGLCITLDTQGYGGPVRLLVGIARDRTLSGLEVLSHTETPGLGSKAAEEGFRAPFRGMTAPLRVTRETAGPNEIEAISGATITTKAVVDGVNRAFERIGQEKGGKTP